MGIQGFVCRLAATESLTALLALLVVTAACKTTEPQVGEVMSHSDAPEMERYTREFIAGLPELPKRKCQPCAGSVPI